MRKRVWGDVAEEMRGMRTIREKLRSGMDDARSVGGPGRGRLRNGGLGNFERDNGGLGDGLMGNDLREGYCCMVFREVGIIDIS